MKYSRKDIEDLRVEVNFIIEKQDYDKSLTRKLNEQKKKAQLKGFRKGKVPISMIKKMYGNSMLVDVINDLLGKEMDKYFESENIKYLGEPLLAEGHEPLDVDINNPDDYSFTFDIGLKPEFEVKGAAEKDSYEKLIINIEDKVIEDELMAMRRRSGKQELTTEDIIDSDILTIDAVELDGKKVKEKGWETSFTIMVDTIQDEKLKKKVLKMKQGDTFNFNIFKLEKDRDEAFVKKYFLNLDKDEEKEIGKDFNGKIKEVRRLVPAEMNEDFFKANFGDEVSDEKAAKEFIREQLSKFYDNESDQLMYRNIMDKMIDKTKFDMSEAFLKRWLKNQEANKDLSDGELEKKLKGFMKEMRWSLIKSAMAEKYDIKINEEEIQQRLYGKAQKYMNQQMQGFSDPNMLNDIYQYLAKDKNQVNQTADEIATDKLFAKLKEVLKLKEKSISLDKFKDLVKSLNDKLEAEKIKD